MYSENNICKKCLKDWRNIKEVKPEYYGIDEELIYKVILDCKYKLELAVDLGEDFEDYDCTINVPETPQSYFDEDMHKLIEEWKKTAIFKTWEKTGVCIYNPEALKKLNIEE